MEEIEITETETKMSDGSISVHCEAVMPDGHRLTGGYIVPARPSNLGDRGFDDLHDREWRRAAVHAQMADKIAELRTQPPKLPE